MAKVCIISGKEVKDGYKVEDDFVICTIRKIKQYFKVAKNNELVVSRENVGQYLAKRKNYEKTLTTHVVLSGIVLLIFILLPIFTTGISLSTLYSILLGVLLAGMIMALAVLSHVPKAAGVPEEAKKAEAAKDARKKGKK